MLTEYRLSNKEFMLHKYELKNENFSIPAGQLTVVPFDTTVSGNELTEDYEWVVPVTGLYLIAFNGYLSFNDSTIKKDIVIEVLKSTVEDDELVTESFRGDQLNGLSASAACLNGTLILELEEDNTLAVRVYASKAATLEVFEDIHLTSLSIVNLD